MMMAGSKEKMKLPLKQKRSAGPDAKRIILQLSPDGMQKRFATAVIRPNGWSRDLGNPES